MTKSKSAPENAHARATQRLQQWEVVGEAYDLVAQQGQEFDQPNFVKKHPWVAPLTAALRFLREQNFHSILPDHFNLGISVPNDLADLSAVGGDIRNLIQVIAEASHRLDEQQQRVVAEARNRGVTWKAIGTALGTTRQSAWAKYSGED